MAEARRKKGRPPKFVRLNEREIHGLSLHSSSGRYYATFSKPRVYFCGEPKLAVKDFLLWQARNGDKRISVGHTIDDPDDPKVEREIDQSLSRGEDAVIDITEEGSLFFGSKVAADDFWEKVRELLLEDPMLAAEMTGIERLAYLQHMEPPLPSRSLKEIGNLYLNDQGAIEGLMEHLDEEVTELKDAATSGQKAGEAVDVSNIAFLVWWHHQS